MLTAQVHRGLLADSGIDLLAQSHQGLLAAVEIPVEPKIRYVSSIDWNLRRRQREEEEILLIMQAIMEVYQ